jgi:hypothetical protein
MATEGKHFSIFVVMPFADEFRDTYELGIKPACIEAGANCERVDEQLFLENILDRIYGEIQKADLIVAEMSGRNPNVFYEIGYAHGIGKQAILLTRNADDIPFDLKHLPHVVYEGQIRKLKSELQRTVRWCIKHPESLKAEKRGDANLGVLGRQIINYLTANGYTKMSFERLGSLMGIDEAQARLLIRERSSEFRYALVKGNKPGIALIESK